eukprot:316009_1
MEETGDIVMGYMNQSIKLNKTKTCHNKIEEEMEDASLPQQEELRKGHCRNTIQREGLENKNKTERIKGGFDQTQQEQQVEGTSTSRRSSSDGSHGTTTTGRREDKY